MQQLPAQVVTDSEQRLNQWEHVCALAETLRPSELLDLGAPQILYRLYHEEPLRLFEPLSVRFNCSCSRERTFNALISLPKAEIQELLEELGSIAMDCEFCNQQYLKDNPELDTLWTSVLMKNTLLAII